MTQRVRDGLGLPAGLYRLKEGGGPVVFVPNGITADRIESVVYATVVPMSGGYDIVIYDDNDDLYVPGGDPNPSPTSHNDQAAGFFDDILRQIFNAAQPAGDFPYQIAASDTRAKIVDDLATIKVDFILGD